MNSIESTFKLCLIGDGNVGKTTFMARHQTGEFIKNYSATWGVNWFPLVFHTTKGTITLNVWDYGGQEKLGGSRDDYFTNADCAILMFDVTNKESYNNIPKWHSDFARVCPTSPIVLVGNKCDVTKEERKILPKMITLHTKLSNIAKYYDVSAKSNYNFEKPFLCLLRVLMKDETLQFVESPDFLPSLN